MGRISQALRSLFVVAAALALLAACGGQKAAVDPPTTHEATSAATASPTPPAMPALAKEHTKAGAKAFVGYFWQVVNYAQSTLDTTMLAQLADSYCDGCRGGSSGIDSLRSSGGRIIGGDNVLVGTRISPEQGGIVLVKARIRHSEQHIVGGASPTSYPAESVTYQMVLVSGDDGWRVDRLELKS